MAGLSNEGTGARRMANGEEETMDAASPGQERRRPAPETAKDILGQLDTALGRIGRARGVAESAGFTNAAAALRQAEEGINATMETVETALRDDLTAALRQRTGG